MTTTERVAIVGAALCAVAAVLPGAVFADSPARSVRVLAISYRAHDGLSRRAYLIVPAWYGPKRHPRIPLVISPHGRGVGARTNIRRWGNLPALGGFAVINPEGQGRRLDAPTNMAARYLAFDRLPFGNGLQRLARREIGGTPLTNPGGYEIRSPLDWARKIALAGVPLQIWWSTHDRIVSDQAQESGLLYRDVKRLNPAAPVSQFVGSGRTPRR